MRESEPIRLVDSQLEGELSGVKKLLQSAADVRVPSGARARVWTRVDAKVALPARPRWAWVPAIAVARFWERQARGQSRLREMLAWGSNGDARRH